MRIPLLALLVCVGCTATDAPVGPSPDAGDATAVPAAVSRDDGTVVTAPAAATAPAVANAADAPSAAEANPAVKLPGDVYEHFGAGACDGPVVEVAGVLRDPDAYADADLRLAGPIAAVCLKKGCWMRLGDDERNVFVKFKDYGFFVPLDCAGRTAVLEGQLAVETQSVADVKHYLEDEGKHEEAAKVTEPRKVLSFVATGVAIRKPTDR